MLFPIFGCKYNRRKNQNGSDLKIYKEFFFFIFTLNHWSYFL